MKDLHNNLELVNALSGTAVGSNTTTNGANVHMEGFESVEFVVTAGPYTDGSYAIKLQHADDDGNGSPDTWADVDSGDLLGSTGTLSSAGHYKLGYRGIKEWVRVVVTSTSVTSGATVSAIAVQGHARVNPKTTQAVT